MKIDGHLDVSQRFGRLRKRRNFADLLKRAHILRSPKLGDTGRLLVKRRHNGKATRSQKAFELRPGVNPAVHLLTRKRRQDAEPESTDGSQRERQGDFRRAW